jgi:hypothetical protein
MSLLTMIAGRGLRSFAADRRVEGNPPDLAATRRFPALRLLSR